MILDFLLLGFSALFAALFGVGVAAGARVRDSGGFFVAVLVGAAAQLVLLTELLSLVSLWRPGALIAGQAISIAGLALVARHIDGEIPSANLKAAAARLHPRALLAVLLREPLAAVVVGLAGLLMLIELYASIRIVPNTWDSMTYHLSRVVYWMQNDSVLQYAGGTERQLAFPINAEVLQGWTMLLSRGERLVQSIQWTAQLGIVAFVLAAGKDFGFRLRDRAVASAAFLAMPIAVTESSSSQNDMVFAFFAVAALLFLVRALNGDKPALVLMAISGGLMFGTKSNGLLVAAALGVAALVIVGRDVKRVVRPALCAAAGVLLLGMFTYGQNIVDRGSLIGTDVASGYRIDSPREIPVSATRILWLWTTSTPDRNLEPIGSQLELAFNSTIVSLAQRIDGLPDQPVWAEFNPSQVEDVVAGGLPLLLLIIPATLLALLRPRSRDQVAYAVASIATVVLILATLKYNDWIGRFLLAPAAIATPLVARLASARVVHGLVLLLLVMSTITVGVAGPMKSLVEYKGIPPLAKANRIGQQTVIKFNEAGSLVAVEALVPKGSRLGIAGFEDGWEYPYAGPHFERTLVRLPDGELDSDSMERYDLDALLITNRELVGQSFFKPVYEDRGHQLILRKPRSGSPGPVTR
jgi:hypothetical protein